MTLFWISFGVLWVIVLTQSLALLEVLRQMGVMQTQLAERSRVLDLHKFDGREVEELDGLAADTLEPVGWDDYLRNRSGVVLLFASRCMTCRSLARKMARLLRRHDSERIPIFAVLHASLEDAREFLDDTKLDPRLLAIDTAGSLAQSLAFDVTPLALAVEHGRIREVRIVSELKHIEALLRELEGSTGAEMVTVA